MTEQMTHQRVVEIITAARARGEHPKLSGLDLSHLNLRGADLSSTNLSRADLRYANVSHANLSYANVSHANLYRADMTGAYLHHANLSGAILRCAILRYANLHRAGVAHANLTDTDLRDAILCHANVYHSDLSGANMSGSNLRGVDLRGVDLTDTEVCGLFADGLPSGNLAFIPTPEGWILTIGCWTGTTHTLREMIAKDTGWPEAEGEQITVRRPMLEAMAAACDTYASVHPNAVADVKATTDRWKKNNN